VTSDAIVLLKDDHKEIRRLFREFQQAGDGAVKKKARLVEQIIERLTVHTFLENEVMYPTSADADWGAKGAWSPVGARRSRAPEPQVWCLRPWVVGGCGLTARANLTSAPGVHHERVRQVEG
jgi:Hemerythrin HHE cation binding domain